MRRRRAKFCSVPSASAVRYVELSRASSAEPAGVRMSVLPPFHEPAGVGSGPDALSPVLAAAFLDYAQARDLFVDPARIRSPKDKPGVVRA